jgi:hypothetical protein
MWRWVIEGQRRSARLVLIAVLLLAAGCGQLPREWRETIHGPDATPTPRLVTQPTPTPAPLLGVPTPPPAPTPLPTLTSAPTRTATITRTATATPVQATLTLQQGAPWYVNGAFRPYDGTEDTYISAWNRNANYADAPVVSVRQGDIMAALLYFNLGDLPRNMTVFSAEMSVYVSVRSNDTPMTITMRAVLKPWMEKEATWLSANEKLLWETPGALGETDRIERPVGEALVDERGVWVAFDMSQLVQTWLRDPQANQGVLLNGEAANAVQYDLTSADARDERHRPRLTLTFPTGAILLAPPKTPTPTIVATPTVDPSRPEVVDVQRLLPIGSTLLARAAGDLRSSGELDIAAAYRSADGRGVRLAIFTYLGLGDAAGDYRLLWNSAELPGAAPVSLDIADLTGDGVPEALLAVTSPTGGKMLYVFVSRPAGYRLAVPVGGSFGGKDYFGESGFALADVNGDGKVEISASSGSQVETYAWDGVNFTQMR